MLSGFLTVRHIESVLAIKVGFTSRLPFKPIFFNPPTTLLNATVTGINY